MADVFKTLEAAAVGEERPLAALLDELRFNGDGLIPAIAQSADTGEVLMLAWMDRTAIERTLEDGYVWYWSRSRQAYWKKGETSGHLQRLNALHVDCDGDAILLKVEQTGPACHTNRQNCFYLQVDGDRVRVISEPG